MNGARPVRLSQPLSDQIPTMMVAWAGFAVGAVLASQRFSVWAVVPVSLISAICAALGCGVDQTITSVVQRFVVVLFTLQVGFLAGAVLLALVEKREHRPSRHQIHTGLRATGIRRNQ